MERRLRWAGIEKIQFEDELSAIPGVIKKKRGCPGGDTLPGVLRQREYEIET